MKDLVIVFAVFAVFVGLAAGCGDDGGSSHPDPDAPESPSEVGPSGPGLAGLLIDPLRQPRPVTDVLACMATTCLFGESGSDGRFTFAIDPSAQVAVKTHPDLERTPRFAAALEPARIVDGTLVDVGTVYTPELPVGAVIGPASTDPQVLAAGDGLELTLNRADVTAPLGEFLYDVAARRLPVEHIPTYPEMAGREVIAVYALHPFTGKSSSPMSVRAPSSLADGTAVDFRIVSEIDGVLSAPVPGHASGGFVSTDVGVGIERFTYLVISRP